MGQVIVLTRPRTVTLERLARALRAGGQAGRRARLHEQTARKGQAASALSLALANWTLLITNVPPARLTLREDLRVGRRLERGPRPDTHPLGSPLIAVRSKLFACCSATPCTWPAPWSPPPRASRRPCSRSNAACAAAPGSTSVAPTRPISSCCWTQSCCAGLNLMRMGRMQSSPIPFSDTAAPRPGGSSRCARCRPGRQSCGRA